MVNNMIVIVILTTDYLLALDVLLINLVVDTKEALKGRYKPPSMSLRPR